MITEHHSPASYWTQQHDYSVKYAHDIYAIVHTSLYVGKIYTHI